MKDGIATSNRRSFVRSAVLSAVTVASLMSFTSAAQAQSIGDIKKKGSITFGIVTDQVPFGFINAKGENDGYDIEITRMMAKELGVEPKFVPITSANRIPQLLTGKVDLLVCALGVYPDRAKVIQYVAPYAAINATIYGAKNDALTKIEGLSGKAIAVEKGSSMEKAITESAPKDANIQRFDDASSAVQALVSGQVQYLGSYSHEFMAVEKAAPGKFASKVVLSTEYEGIAGRPTSKELTDWAGDFMKRHQADGSLNALHKKYFGVDFPKMPASLPDITFSIK